MNQGNEYCIVQTLVIYKGVVCPRTKTNIQHQSLINVGTREAQYLYLFTLCVLFENLLSLAGAIQLSLLKTLFNVTTLKFTTCLTAETFFI